MLYIMFIRDLSLRVNVKKTFVQDSDVVRVVLFHPSLSVKGRH